MASRKGGAHRHKRTPKVGPKVSPSAFATKKEHAGRWQVKETTTQPRVGFGEHTMWVPLGNTEAEAGLRWHEAQHIANPPKFDKVSDWVKDIHTTHGVEVLASELQAAEDYRINHYGMSRTYRVLGRAAKERIQKQLSASIPIKEVRQLITTIAKQKGLAAAVKAAFGASSYYGTFKELAGRRPSPELSEVLKAATRILNRIDYSYRDGHEFTEAVAMSLAALRSPPKPEPGKVEGTAWGIPEDTDTTGFGALTIHTPRLTQPCDTSAKGHRPTDDPSDGAVRYPHRWRPWHGQWSVFRKRTRERPRASILFDLSGSMGWKTEELRKLLLESPASTIGVYGGRTSGGSLVVLAEGGRHYHNLDRIHLSDHFDVGYGNVVDGPALEWLARQPGPRVWVSDGGVTGLADCGAEKLREQCRDICQKHSITQFDPRRIEDTSKQLLELCK